MSTTTEHREQELLERFHQHGDFTARAAFVERAMPLVHHVARRYADRGEAYDDLVQAGAVGLLKAVDRFDPERGVRFSTFAIPNIAGEIRRHFRDRGWAVRVPRDVQERDAQLTSAGERLVAELQRMPSVAELADATGLTLDQVLDTLAGARNYTAVSLDAPIDEDRTGMDRLCDSEDGYERVEQRIALVEGLRGLQDREQRIVALRFYEGLTQSEIADRLGISQMHVSRLLRHALDTMRRRIEDTTPTTQRALAPIG
ncbi:SigB/SigF/SigG family RNA polymerase sigma factor [Paraconexibacter sp.]|uniref:SigB/SigF/SigG family RNA polymerase sigma factor n=1 Tax=Paraconexibacter sp. TaxID=2949640 RepID=UPI0035693F4D